MARRIKARLIMRLLAAGLSQNAMARSQKVSKRSVAEVSRAARDAGVGELNEAIGPLLEESNAAPFQKREGSRRASVFEGSRGRCSGRCRRCPTRSANGCAAGRSSSTATSPTGATTTRGRI